MKTRKINDKTKCAPKKLNALKNKKLKATKKKTKNKKMNND